MIASLSRTQIFLDVGSTNSRAWLVRDGRIVHRRTAPVGVRDSARDGSTDRVRATVRELIASLLADDDVAGGGRDGARHADSGRGAVRVVGEAAPARDADDRMWTPPGVLPDAAHLRADDVEPPLIAAAGMITSALGLTEVPHVAAPAGVADLARGAVLLEAPDLAPVPILLVPGVRTAGDSPDALTHDVMRGEETLLIGLLALGLLAPPAPPSSKAPPAPEAAPTLATGAARRRDRNELVPAATGVRGDGNGGPERAATALLNAGSHWKLMRVDEQGRIAGSRTSLGGEIVHAAHSATILSASLPDGPLASLLPEWLERGAAAGRQEGLLRALFAVRLLDQQKQSTPEERQAFLVGACIADDLDALAARGAITVGLRLLISGPALVPAAWAHLLRRLGCDPVILDTETTEHAFVTGLATVAHAYHAAAPHAAAPHVTTPPAAR